MGQPVAKCVICDSILRHFLATYCRRCGNIMERFEARGKADNAVRVKALKRAWDKEFECFRCYYSGIQLNDDNVKDPRYITFDYLTPVKGGEMVITSALLKTMKSDLSTDEFKTIIVQLAKHFEAGSEVDENIFKLKNWRG